MEQPLHNQQSSNLVPLSSASSERICREDLPATTIRPRGVEGIAERGRMRFWGGERTQQLINDCFPVSAAAHAHSPADRPRAQSAISSVIGALLNQARHFKMTGNTDADNMGLVTGIVDLTAGSIGGAAQVYVSQPLDTIKVKQQAFPGIYSGLLDCLKRTYRQDGIVRGLYAGTAPAVIANVAENSVLFAAYGGCQRLIAYHNGKDSVKDLSIIETANAGFLAAFFSTFVLCPTELIKCKLQGLREMRNYVEPGMTEVRSPLQMTRYVYQTEGIQGFYRGLSSTFIREMPGYFCFFGGYESVREYFRKPGQTRDDVGVAPTIIAGAAGGIALWTVVYPADAIKSRIQVKNMRRGMFSVGMEIVRKEGVTSLYRGLSATLLRTIPASATLFVIYEYTKKMMMSTL